MKRNYIQKKTRLFNALSRDGRNWEVNYVPSNVSVCTVKDGFIYNLNMDWCRVASQKEQVELARFTELLVPE